MMADYFWNLHRDMNVDCLQKSRGENIYHGRLFAFSCWFLLCHACVMTFPSVQCVVAFVKFGNYLNLGLTPDLKN